VSPLVNASLLQGSHLQNSIYSMQMRSSKESLHKQPLPSRRDANLHQRQACVTTYAAQLCVRVKDVLRQALEYHDSIVLVLTDTAALDSIHTCYYREAPLHVAEAQAPNTTLCCFKYFSVPCVVRTAALLCSLQQHKLCFTSMPVECGSSVRGLHPCASCSAAPPPAHQSVSSHCCCARLHRPLLQQP